MHHPILSAQKHMLGLAETLARLRRHASSLSRLNRSQLLPSSEPLPESPDRLPKPESPGTGSSERHVPPRMGEFSYFKENAFSSQQFSALVEDDTSTVCSQRIHFSTACPLSPMPWVRPAGVVRTLPIRIPNIIESDLANPSRCIEDELRDVEDHSPPVRG